MKRWKRFLAGALCAVALTALLAPSLGAAYAEEPTQEQIAAASVSSDTDAAVEPETEEAAVEAETEPQEETSTQIISAFEWSVDYWTLNKNTEAETVANFPAELNVTLEDGTAAVVPVTWVCGEDYDGTDYPGYYFFAELPEGYALAEGLTEDDLPCIELTIVESSSCISTYATARAATFQKISPTTALSAEYGFSFNTLYKDVSDGQGAYSKSTTVSWVYQDIGTQEWQNYYGVSSEAEVAKIEGGDHWVALLDNTQSASYWCDGRVWFRWNNVGYYNGVAADLKVTLVGIEQYSTAGKVSVHFNEDQPGVINVSSNDIYGGGITHPTFKFEFFAHGTNTPIHVKGHATFFDLDYGQGLSLGENIVAGYYLDTGWFSVGGVHAGFINAPNGPENTITNDNTKGWVTAFFSGTYFTVTYCTGPNTDYTTWNPPAGLDYTRPGHPYCGDFNSLFGFRGDTVGYFDTPAITKRTSSSAIYTNETFTYYLEVPIPLESTSYRYDSFVIQDVIPSQLYITNPASITVTNKTNSQNITTWFTNSSTSSQVYLKASGSGQANKQDSFYGSTIEIAVPVAVRSNVTAASWQGLALSGNGRVVSNTGSVQVARSRVDSGATKTRNSNSVTTAISAKTQVQVINGSASWSSNTNNCAVIGDVSGYSGYTVRKVPVGDNMAYSFAPGSGYVLKSITVNGVAVDISGYGDSFSYTFSNIFGVENHILVEYQRATGYVELYKTSANPDITDGNGCYSLGGAVYGIYTDYGCTKLVTTMTTDASGYAKSGAINTGTYYLKEITPPAGYELDETVYTVTISNAATTRLDVQDDPGNDPVVITITKIQKYPNQYIPSLEGAEFTVRYYAGQYATTANLPANATRTWVIQTKARTTSSGKIVYETMLSDRYKVGGDAFYYIGGLVTVPLGTLTVQETKAPEGYTLSGGFMNDSSGNSVADSDGVILLHVTQAGMGDSGSLVGGNYYTQQEEFQLCSLTLNKKDNGGNALAGVSFKLQILNPETGLYDDLTTGVTDANGQIRFGDLVFGKYRLIETATNGSASLLADPIDVTLPVTSEQSAGGTEPTYTIDGVNYYCDVTLTVQNGQIVVPHTGAADAIAMIAAGLCALGAATCLIALFRRKRTA